MESKSLRYTPAMLARLAYSHTAYELSERLVSAVGTHADAYGHGAFITEEATMIIWDARALLEASRHRRQAPRRFVHGSGREPGLHRRDGRGQFGSAERRFREALLFPHRYPDNGGLGYTVAPYAVEEPDCVREQLDAWVVEHRQSSGPDREEPQPVTRGLTAMAGKWIAERIGQVLELSNALMKRERPQGVSYKDAKLRHARLKVELFERMLVDVPGDPAVES